MLPVKVRQSQWRIKQKEKLLHTYVSINLMSNIWLLWFKDLMNEFSHVQF